jgi:hypothetical protein
MAHLTLLLASVALPLLTPAAHGGAVHTMTFVEYILQSNVINIAIVMAGLVFILSKLNIPEKLDASTQQAIQPLQNAQAFRNKTESKLTALTHQFETLEQAKAEILNMANQTAVSIKLQFEEKEKHALQGLALSYESKKQREASLLQAAVLNDAIKTLFNEVESKLPAYEVCHQRLVALLITQLQEEPMLPHTLPEKTTV